MKKILISFFIALTCLLSGCSSRSSVPVVLFDTDMGNDIDDMLALQMLFNYHKAGMIDLEGITISKCHPAAIEFVDAFCRYNGFEDMPLGYVYNGPNSDYEHYLKATLDARYEGKPVMTPVRNIDSDIPQGHEKLLEMLNEQKDGSVLLIAVGPLTNISRLLQMEEGREAVKKKVRRLCIMSGDYREGANPEWNVLQDIEASRVVYELCPVPLTSSGFEIGDCIRYPAESIEKDFGDPCSHPISVAYSNFQQMPYCRQTWDLTSVLDAVEPDNGLFGHSEKGWIRVEPDGRTIFTADPAGLHEYITVTPENAAKVRDLLVKRVVEVPAH